MYYGGVDQNTCYANLARFKTDPSCTALILTRAKGSTGLTINEADTVINYSHDWKYEEREQSLARNHRDGQTKPVTIYDMYAPKTSDVKIMKVMESRESIAERMKNLSDFRRLVEEL